MNNVPVTPRRRTREEVATDLARLVASADQKLVLLQHATHNALRATRANDVRHWLRQAEKSHALLVDAAIDVTDGLEALQLLYPEAHGDGESTPGRPPRCACGRVAATCNARVQLEVGARMWVDERGKLRDVTDAGSEAIPAGQR